MTITTFSRFEVIVKAIEGDRSWLILFINPQIFLMMSLH